MDVGVPYKAGTRDVTVSAAQDLIEITAPATAAILVEMFRISQNTEVGDAQEEQLEYRVVRGVGATSGSGGSTPTAQPVNDVGEAAFAGTIESNNTTKMTAGGGSLEELDHGSWNVRQEKEILPPNGYGWVIGPSQKLTFELVAAPGDAVDINFDAYFRQIG